MPGPRNWRRVFYWQNFLRISDDISKSWVPAARFPSGLSRRMALRVRPAQGFFYEGVLMNIFGVWLYGALTLVLLAVQAFRTDNTTMLVFVIASSGAAYAAEFMNELIKYYGQAVRWLAWAQLLCVGYSVALAVAAFAMML